MQLYGLFRFRKTAAIVMCSRYSQSRQKQKFSGSTLVYSMSKYPNASAFPGRKGTRPFIMHSRNTPICQLLRVALCEGGNACASCRMNSV
mmetsp:Transcript_17509/g.26790  ORF Transcript_17509/g.26790 Transcript_17509/m.26790 type:complete len:90 (-) Transcript_17509:198-467(-)